MRNDAGDVVTDLEGILTAFRSFYQSLFSPEAVDLSVQASLLSCLSASLPSGPSSLCEGPLTVGEVRDALEGMARGKSPGSDGLPAEFYLKCWEIVGRDLVEVLNEAFVAGQLSLSQRTGQVVLLFKKGDRVDRCNWRPITLLNADYKLCARALAGRLLKVLHLVVHLDQTCGVLGRYIGENVALLGTWWTLQTRSAARRPSCSSIRRRRLTGLIGPSFSRCWSVWALALPLCGGSACCTRVLGALF